MNPPTQQDLEQAERLEIAAYILRTGYKFEVRRPNAKEWLTSAASLEWYVVNDWQIRLVPPQLLQPPEGSGLRLLNPNNLTAEQVGEGFRLVTDKDSCDQPHEVWIEHKQKWSKAFQAPCIFEFFSDDTYRLPVSVPWPTANKWAKEKAAFAAGKKIQVFNRVEQRWENTTAPRWLPNAEYRIAPETKLVPLGPDGVPPGSVFRAKYWSQPCCYRNFFGVNDDGLSWVFRGRTIPNGFLSWEELKADWQIKRPGEDWQPCSKEEQV